jgi:AAA ATPase containing von Willebrand factor type A (vWA) domain
MAVTLDSLKKTIKKNKGRSQALAWLADMELATGEFESAMNHVDAALAASPSDVPAMLVRAKILTIQQDFAGSISEYKKVLAKDPFCLSAHKKMGESYDKLGKIAERNACFRRVHDMDPLDPFWKDEYDVLTEEEQAAMVAPPMDDDSSFTMDMDSDTDNAEFGGEENVFANLAASISNADEENDSSMNDLLNSLNSASGENAENAGEVQDQTFDGNVLSTSEVSSAITGILGGDDDLDTAELNGKESAGATSNLVASSLFSSALASSALAASSQDEAPKSEETFNIEDQPIDAESNATNVDDAFSSLLGDDELPEEASAENLSLDEKPSEENVSIEEWSPTPETPKEEDKATNVDDAFSSLLGDDELPEETKSEETSGGLFEKSADAEFSLDEAPATETSPVEEGSIPTTHMEFSDDEVASATEESASEDLSLDEIQTKEEDKATNVDDAFSSIFGDDELPEEKPLEETVAETSTEEVPAENLSLDEPSNEMLAETQNVPSEEPVAEESFGGLFEKSADADFTLGDEPSESTNESVIPTTHMDFSDVEDNVAEASAPAAETEEVLAEPQQETQPEEVVAQTENVAAQPEESSSISEDLSVSVDGAFDALFGDEEPATKTAEAAVESSEPAPVAETAAEPAKEDNLANEMGGAFASMFGNEDDLSLPEDNKNGFVASAPVEETLSQEATTAKIEEESVKDSVDESFDSIFGEDDLPEEKTANEVPAKVAEKAPEQTAEPSPVREVAAAAPSADLDSIDSEVSNAFKGLFDEDDTLPETDEPSNKGVDYLMSGDSDDEVSASLVNNADAPLSRGAADLDESLNTATLADIYMEQGVYNKALEIYSDLAKKNPNNPEIKSRLEEVEKLCREKFGEA